MCFEQNPYELNQWSGANQWSDATTHEVPTSSRIVTMLDPVSHSGIKNCPKCLK